MRRRVIITVTVLALAAAVLIPAAGCGEEEKPAKTEPQITTQPSSTQPATRAAVNVFLIKGETVFQVSREVGVPGSRQALEEMLKGPTEAEKQQGLTTAIPAGTGLNSYKVENGVAKADFSAELKNYGGGSAVVQAIISQIENTVKSNDAGVTAVEITIDGVSSDEALQP